MALPLFYSWRNLLVRRLSTSLTLLLITVIVVVLAVLLSFAAGIRQTLKNSGHRDRVIVLKPGSTAESTSVLFPEETNLLVQTPGIRFDPSGQPLISIELCIQTSLPRLGYQDSFANVAVRGVDPVAFAIRPEIQIVEGRLFDSGALEVIVGEAASKRFGNLKIDGEISLGRLGNRLYKVVGIFRANNSSFESEIWAPRSMITTAYSGHYTSSATIQCIDESQAQTAINYIKGPSVKLQAQKETDYYQELARTTRQLVVLSVILIAIMGLGAVFAMANTMYAAVDHRRREFAMLRTLGFSRIAIQLTIFIESLLTCLVSCIIGLLIGSAFIAMNIEQDFISDVSFSSLTYQLRMTPTIMISCLILACGVGIAGALAPAVRASRIPILEALRKA